MKKLLSILLCALLCLSLLPTSVLADGVGSVMPLSAGNTTEFAGGTGSASDPYLISTKEHLNNVRNYLSAYFKMTENLVFTEKDFAEGGAFDNDGQGWIPIGREGAPFKGVFDGDGHIIQGLVVHTTGYYAGLFGYVNYGTIQNVGLVGGEISLVKDSGHCFAGGIVGYVYENGTIRNVNMTGGEISLVKKGSGHCFAGGIVGCVDSKNYRDGSTGSTGTFTISECYNTSNVSIDATFNPSESYFKFAGGIVGVTGGDNRYYRVNVTIENCYNTGNVSGGAENGGIVGRVGNRTNIEKCHNTGTVSGGSAGGIVGTSTNASISECYNKGVVSGYTTGGIAGDFYKGDIEKCYNTGSVFADTIGTIDINAGGIVGDMSCAEPSTWPSLHECYNTGNVSASSASSRRFLAGGIAGEVSVARVDIYNCYNTGSVSATSTGNSTGNISIYAAGIAGWLSGQNVEKSSMSNCYSTGNVSATSTGNSTGDISIYAGGIAGCSYDVPINNCYYLNTSAQKGVGEGTYFATRYTSEQLKDSKSFVGFDFDSVWTMEGNEKYPYPELQEVTMDFSPGDLNGDGKVTNADAIYLLQHTFFPEDYPVNQPCDFNGDGKVTNADAIYLLQYTFFPEDYPLYYDNRKER